MTLAFETLVGTSDKGVRYRMQIPRLSIPASAFDGFYKQFAETVAGIGAGLSSLVITGTGEVLFSRFVSVRFEITAFREGRAEQYAVRSQVWDLKNEIILTLKDVKLQDCLPRRRFWLKNEGKNGVGWYISGRQIHLYICNSNQYDPGQMRRSEYHLMLQEALIELAKSELFGSLLEFHSDEEN